VPEKFVTAPGTSSKDTVMKPCYPVRKAGGCFLMRVRMTVLAAVVFLSVLGYVSAPASRIAATGTVGPISAAEFQELSDRLSEPEGYFDTDNLISNEAGYLKILPLFKQLGVRGGVYIGVGPDQNYSYIAAVHPELSFIVDIRRQNLLQHLYFKALFELSGDRAAFLQRLFGRRIRPDENRRRQQDLARLLELVRNSSVDLDLQNGQIDEAEQAIREWFPRLHTDDFKAIEFVARNFFEAGLELQFTSYNRPPSPRYPTYESLLLETDSLGNRANYLALEESYQMLRQLHRENRIIPVVGDFAGSGAMARVAQELRTRRLEVSCFYVSNVEFYLFDGARWDAYARNMRDLPWARQAIIIRSVSNNWRFHPAHIPGYYMTTVAQRASSFFENQATGRNTTYWDLVQNDYIAPQFESLRR